MDNESRHSAALVVDRARSSDRPPPRPALARRSL